MPKEKDGMDAKPKLMRSGTAAPVPRSGASAHPSRNPGTMATPAPSLGAPLRGSSAAPRAAPEEHAPNFASGSAVAEVAHLMGDPARAHMLCALMGGVALTAGELASHGGITPQTASGHLAQMVAARLLAVERQGRHRYFRLAGPEVAEAVAALMALAALAPRRHRPPGPRDVALRRARTCYDHMAGRLAVALADKVVARGHVELSDGAGLVTPAGRAFFADLGLEADWPASGRRPLCRTCLDWSERRPHLAGRLGAALLERMLALGWLERVPGSRALTVTRRGEAGLAAWFDLDVHAGEGA